MKTLFRLIWRLAIIGQGKFCWNPEDLSSSEKEVYLKLHRLVRNEYTSVEDVLKAIEEIPAALKQQDRRRDLPLHLECMYQRRSIVIAKCIELYPQALTISNFDDCLPLHELLRTPKEGQSGFSSEEDALMMIEKYPAAVRHHGGFSGLPIHIECSYQCRSTIIAKCVDLYPEGFARSDEYGCLPLHRLLANRSSSAEDVLMMIEKYPAALQHQNRFGNLPIHIECHYLCRSSVIKKCMELYPEGLAVGDDDGYLPLHRLLANGSSSVEDVLMMIKAFPAALNHQNRRHYLPLHIECIRQCRSSIISACVQLYPKSLRDDVISLIIQKINRDKVDIHPYASVLSMVFTARPMSLYVYDAELDEDIRKNPRHRRKILNLLPRHVFSQMHEADYADLNWQPRSAMLQLLSQMKIHQQGS